MRFALTLLALVMSGVFTAACQAPTPEPERTFCDSSNYLDTSPIQTSGYGMGMLNQRNNQNSKINSSNVTRLELRYSLVDPKAQIRRGAPAASRETLYYTSRQQALAVDRQSGCVRWQYQYPNANLRSASILLIEATANTPRLVIVGSKDARVIALNANNGEPVWQSNAQNVDYGNYSMITGGLQYSAGKIFVPIASEEVAKAVLQPFCCYSHGAVKALDAQTGELLWSYETTEPATRSDEKFFRLGPNGVSVWSTPLVDVKRKQVLVGAGQNFTPPATANADAILALDIDTGELKWRFKATEVDFYNSTCGQELSPFKHCADPSFDFDMVTPLLAQTGAGEERVFAADKGGNVYALNPDNGALIWQQKLGAGGLLGGIHWAMAADDKQLYVPIADFAVPKVAIVGGELNQDLLNISPGPVENATPGIYALELETGHLNWQLNDLHEFEGEQYPSIYSAGVSVVNDLVLASSLDGVLKAIDSKDGSVLWQFQSAIPFTDIHGNLGRGGSIDSVGAIAAGDEILLNSGYSVFNIGGRNAYQAGPGNALITFALKAD